MKLYEVPRNSRIRIVEIARVEDRYKQKPIIPDIDEVLDFKKIDGMYSFCYNSSGQVVRLAAWTNVEVIGPMEKDQQ